MYLLICLTVFMLAFVTLLLPSLTSAPPSLLPALSHILPVLGTNVKGSVLFLSACETTAGVHTGTNRPFCLRASS